MNPFDSDIAALEARYAAHPLRNVVFYGSSSIRLWPGLTRAFPEIQIENWGFGGSNLSDAAHFFERVVAPRKPRAILIYAGDNDLARGASPSDVWGSLVQLLNSRDALLQKTSIAFLALKPSPSRLHLRAQIEETNEWCARELAGRQNTIWVDVFEPMLGEDGWGRRELFTADLLHLSRAGYDVWNQTLRREVDWLGSN